jgi:hypothetical protein
MGLDKTGINLVESKVKNKSKDMPVTGRGGL